MPELQTQFLVLNNKNMFIYKYIYIFIFNWIISRTSICKKQGFFSCIVFGFKPAWNDIMVSSMRALYFEVNYVLTSLVFSRFTRCPGRHEKFTQSRLNVGPASATLGQHYPIIRSPYRVFWTWLLLSLHLTLGFWRPFLKKLAPILRSASLIKA